MGVLGAVLRWSPSVIARITIAPSKGFAGAGISDTGGGSGVGDTGIIDSGSSAGGATGPGGRSSPGCGWAGGTGCRVFRGRSPDVVETGNSIGISAKTGTG